MAELNTQLNQVLTIYGEEINVKLSSVTRSSMKELVEITKSTAPVGRREGQYRDSITADYSRLHKKRGGGGYKGRAIASTWYVKAPDYRLTHLLIHGHATKNGGRTAANPFLRNATEKVVAEYEQKVQEVLSDGN